MSEKGAKLKRNFEKVVFELQSETKLTEVNPKRLRSVAVSEETQLPEAWTKEELISSVSIRNKEERLVQECWMLDIVVHKSFVQNVNCLLSAQIESHDTKVEEDIEDVMTTVVSSIPNIQTYCSMLSTSYF